MGQQEQMIAGAGGFHPDGKTNCGHQLPPIGEIAVAVENDSVVITQSQADGWLCDHFPKEKALKLGRDILAAVAKYDAEVAGIPQTRLVVQHDSREVKMKKVGPLREMTWD